MASCTFNPGVSGSNPYVILYVEQQGQNIANNTSNIGWELVLYRPYNIESSAPKSYSVVVNGETMTNTTTTIGGSGAVSIASGSKTIAHAADGTKSISFSFSFEMSITWGSTWIGTGGASGSMTLTTIPRASSISLSPTNVSLGSNLTVSINRASTAFTHTLQHDFYVGSWTTFATSVATSNTLTTPLSWASRIPNATVADGRIRCITYNGSTYIGETIAYFSATVPSSVIPNITSISAAETVGGLSSYFGAFIQSKSIPRVTIAASGAYGSTVSTYSTTIGSSTYSGSTFTCGILNTAGAITIKTTVTDSRGRTASKSTTITVVPYSPPTISSFSVVRCNSSGAEVSNGTYVKVVATGSISSCNNKNSNSHKVEYKLSSSSTWTNLISGTGYAINLSQAKTITGGFITSSSYNFRITLYDYFVSAASSRSVSTEFTLMNYGASGKGLAFGKISEKDVIEVAMPTEFGNKVTISGTDLNNWMNSLNSYRDPISIPKGANLNSYQTVGMYYCPLSADVQTMSNCPTGNAFSMRVYKHAGVGQELIEFTPNNNEKRFQRNYYDYEKRWGGWHRVYTEADRPPNGDMEWVAGSESTNFEKFTIPHIKAYRWVLLLLNAASNRSALATTMVPVDWARTFNFEAKRATQCIYAQEPNNYTALAYFPDDTTIYLKTISTWDRVDVYLII